MDVRFGSKADILYTYQSNTIIVEFCSIRKIGCLPVVKKGKLVGMITSTDILRAYVNLAHEVDKMFKNLDR